VFGGLCLLSACGFAYVMYRDREKPPPGRVHTVLRKAMLASALLLSIWCRPRGVTSSHCERCCRFIDPEAEYRNLPFLIVTPVASTANAVLVCLVRYCFRLAPPPLS
jgi:hypothetical protein